MFPKISSLFPFQNNFKLSTRYSVNKQSFSSQPSFSKITPNLPSQFAGYTAPVYVRNWFDKNPTSKNYFISKNQFQVSEKETQPLLDPERCAEAERRNPKGFSSGFVHARGEIAIKTIKKMREMGIYPIFVPYLKQDENSIWVKMADIKIEVSSLRSIPEAKRAFAIAEQINPHTSIGVAPGYGNLSEEPEFPGMCEASGGKFVFIGPNSESMKILGDKIISRETLRGIVPIIKGYHTEEGDDAKTRLAKLLAAADDIGYPIIIKDANGGGGKNLRIAHNADELEKGGKIPENCFIEKYLDIPLLLEVQVFIDKKGIIHILAIRDCSRQNKKKQKVFHVTRSPKQAELHYKVLYTLMVDYATKIANAAPGYRGPLTVELLLDHHGKLNLSDATMTEILTETTLNLLTKGILLPHKELAALLVETIQSKADLYFGECNTRLQVEAEEGIQIISTKKGDTQGKVSCIEIAIRIAQGYTVDECLLLSVPELDPALTTAEKLDAIYAASPNKVAFEARLCAQKDYVHEGELVSGAEEGYVHSMMMPKEGSDIRASCALEVGTYVNTMNIDQLVDLRCVGAETEEQARIKLHDHIENHTHVSGIHINKEYVITWLKHEIEFPLIPVTTGTHIEVDVKYINNLENQRLADLEAQRLADLKERELAEECGDDSSLYYLRPKK